MKLVLASKSPRRSEILKNMGYEFETVNSGFDESSICIEKNPVENIKAIALGKANEAARHMDSCLSADTVILSADTIVVCDGKVLLKPTDEVDAKNMLLSLSGSKHEVYTAVALKSENREDVFLAKTDVYFYDLYEEDINRYIETGEPLDKAGAYGIQGKGGLFVRKIDGDYYNVVGLPVSETARVLRTYGIEPAL